MTTINFLNFEEDYVTFEVTRRGVHKHKDDSLTQQERATRNNDLMDAGSAKDYHHVLLAETDDQTNVPTENALRQQMFREKHKSDAVRNQMENLNLLADGIMALTGSRFIRKIITSPNCSFDLFLDEQLQVVNPVPPENRILLNDCSGGISKAPKSAVLHQKKAKKQRTYSFYASMKDIREYGNVKAHF